MEAEYAALSMAIRYLLCFKRLVQTIFMSIGFKKNHQFNILCSVFEDNARALSLENLELPRMTPRSRQPENTRFSKVESRNFHKFCLKHLLKHGSQIGT